MPRTLVIGAGQIAKQHLGALDESHAGQAIGVCDLSPAMAESTAERFGVPAWGVDYRRMLAELKPEAVHITTPAPTHHAIACDCLRAGAAVFVEKPITGSLEQLEDLLQLSQNCDRPIVEDYNYLFNDDIAQLLADRDEGLLGDVLSVEVQINLPIFEQGSRFADSDAPHPAMREPLGAVSDFLTHLAYLAHAFVGSHRSVTGLALRRLPSGGLHVSDFKALIVGDRAMAVIGFSATSEIDGFWVRVEGAKRRVEVNLFEVGSVATHALGGPKPLAPVRNMLARSGAERRNARRSLSRKLSGGPGPYEGLWRLVAEFHERLSAGAEPPIGPATIRQVNAIVHAVADADAAVASGEAVA